MKRNYIHKSSDPVLKLVLAEIHKSAQKPDKGFLTTKQWAEKWNLKLRHASRIITLSVKKRILVTKRFRINTNGKILLTNHYGLKTK